jgi:hypothetical protein
MESVPASRRRPAAAPVVVAVPEAGPEAGPAVGLEAYPAVREVEPWTRSRWSSRPAPRRACPRASVPTRRPDTTHTPSPRHFARRSRRPVRRTAPGAAAAARAALPLHGPWTRRLNA